MRSTPVRSADQTRVPYRQLALGAMPLGRQGIRSACSQPHQTSAMPPPRSPFRRMHCPSPTHPRPHVARRQSVNELRSALAAPSSYFQVVASAGTKLGDAPAHDALRYAAVGSVLLVRGTSRVRRHPVSWRPLGHLPSHPTRNATACMIQPALAAMPAVAA